MDLIRLFQNGSFLGSHVEQNVTLPKNVKRVFRQGRLLLRLPPRPLLHLLLLPLPSESHLPCLQKLPPIQSRLLLLYLPLNLNLKINYLPRLVRPVLLHLVHVLVPILTKYVVQKYFPLYLLQILPIMSHHRLAKLMPR